MTFSAAAAVYMTAIGTVIFLLGIFISKYPRQGRFLKLKGSFNISSIAEIKYIKAVLNFLTRNKTGRVYKFSEEIINSSEANLSVQELYLLKVASVLFIGLVVVMVRYTNIDAMRTEVISKSGSTVELFSGSKVDNYAYNLSLYNSILKRVGEQTLLKLNENRQVEAVKKVLPDICQTDGKEEVDEKAKAFVKTFNSVMRMRLLDFKNISIIFAAFWLPELLLLLRRLLLSNVYKKEVIKLENVFELLGSIDGFRTIDIIEEMSKASNSYKKHLLGCKELFKTERELALESLKKSVKNNRFSKLIDVMRIYAIIDKGVAIQILERNRIEKEEEILLTAEEDVDIIDIIAFISIVPILLELANLLMKPMLDMIYESFKFI